MWHKKEMAMERICRLDFFKSNLSVRQKTIRYIIILYSLLLLSANFVQDHSFQIFYFSYSAGTLLVQLAFCGIIAFTETIGFRKTNQIIWATALLNLSVALLTYFFLEIPIPDFWVNHDIDSFEIAHQLNIIFLLTVGYVCSTLTMVYVAKYLRVFLGRSWLLFRVMIILAIGLLVDMTVLLPILFFVAPDRYMALWKVLSLGSVKLSLSLIAVPISYFLVHLIKIKTKKELNQQIDT